MHRREVADRGEVTQRAHPTTVLSLMKKQIIMFMYITINAQ